MEQVGHVENAKKKRRPKGRKCPIFVRAFQIPTWVTWPERPKSVKGLAASNQKLVPRLLVVLIKMVVLPYNCARKLNNFRICHCPIQGYNLKMSLITCIFCKCQIPAGYANQAKYKEHLQVQLCFCFRSVLFFSFTRIVKNR